jgi:hypothetical protein
LVSCLLRAARVTVSTICPEELPAVVASGQTFPCLLCDSLDGVAITERLNVLRALLEADGVLIASVRNSLHHEYLRSVLRSDLPSDANPAEHVGYATMMKRFLDARFLPHLADVSPAAASPEFFEAAKPLFQQARVDPARGRRYLDASHHVFVADRRAVPANRFADTPLSFVCCVNDELQLNANLLASPALAAGSPHELILVRGATSIGDAFNHALSRATQEIVILVQQDIYLPLGWDSQFVAGFNQAIEQFDPLGVVGLFGVAFRGRPRTEVGRVVDRHKLLNTPTSLPALVDGLDELLLAFPRGTPVRLDPALGFHLYGTDACFQAAARSHNNVVIEAPVFHNSLYSRRSEAFHVSRRLLLAKWPDVRPLHTSMGQLETQVDPGPPPRSPVDPKTIIGQQQEEIARQKTRIRQLEKKVASQQSRILQMQNSRLWRMRGRLIAALRPRRRAT